MSRVVILGAGLTGLSAAWHMGGSAVIYERGSEPGGLARTLRMGGYRMDLAPHLLHIRSEYVRALVFEKLGLRARSFERRAAIYFEGKAVPYPFELHLSRVSPGARDECLRGLDQAEAGADQGSLRAGSYRDYAIRAFGPGIAGRYLLPFNAKLWQTDPSEMTCEWMKFLPTADPASIRRGALDDSAPAFGYNAEFHYPIGEGIRELPDLLSRGLDIRYGSEAVSIETEARRVRFKDGSVANYDTLISTIPLKALAGMTGLGGLRDAASRLKGTTVYCVNAAFRGKVPEGLHWLYVPGPEQDFYRLNFPRNFFERAAPGAEQMILAEVSAPGPIGDVPALEARVISQLRAMGLFTIEEITFVHTLRIEPAYCVHDRARGDAVEMLTVALGGLGIITAGRYGRWGYDSMEGALLEGRDVALGLGGAVRV